MANRYDTILGMIPASSIGTGTLLRNYGVALDISATVGACLALLFVTYGLFVDPPRDGALGPHH